MRQPFQTLREIEDTSKGVDRYPLPLGHSCRIDQER